MPFRSATMPSMLKTPSVTITMNRAPSARASFNCVSRSAMSLFA